VKKRKDNARGRLQLTPKDENARGERYLALPNGRICKLLSGVSLYDETEGAGRGAVLPVAAVLPPFALRAIVRLQSREKERERKRNAEHRGATRDKRGG